VVDGEDKEGDRNMIPTCRNCKHCIFFGFEMGFACKKRGEGTSKDRTCSLHEWADDDEMIRREIEWGDE